MLFYFLSSETSSFKAERLLSEITSNTTSPFLSYLKFEGEVISGLLRSITFVDWPGVDEGR